MRVAENEQKTETERGEDEVERKAESGGVCGSDGQK